MPNTSKTTSNIRLNITSDITGTYSVKRKLTPKKCSKYSSTKRSKFDNDLGCQASFTNLKLVTYTVDVDVNKAKISTMP